MVIFTIQGHLEVKTKMVAVAAILNFLHNSPRILCNTSFSTNLNTLNSLERLVLHLNVI